MYVFIDSNNDQFRSAGEEQLYISNKLDERVLFVHSTDATRQVTKNITFNAKGEARFGVIGDPVNRDQREGVFGLCDDRKDDSLGRTIFIGRKGRVQASQITATDGVSCL